MDNVVVALWLWKCEHLEASLSVIICICLKQEAYSMLFQE